MPFTLFFLKTGYAATGMDLEIIILSEVTQRKTNIMVEARVGGPELKSDTNECIYKTETKSQISNQS